MKKFLALTALLLILTLLFACGGSGASEVADFDPTELSDALLDCGGFTDLLSKLDVAVAAELYGIDKDTVEESSIYLGTGATAEEITVFKAADADAATAIAEKLEARAQAQIKAYENYVPKEVPKIEAAILWNNGCYAVYIVAEDADAAQAALDTFVK